MHGKGLFMDCISTNFGVDRSSHFPFRARRGTCTDTVTHKHTDATDHPIDHAATVVGNNDSIGIELNSQRSCTWE